MNHLFSLLALSLGISMFGPICYSSSEDIQAKFNNLMRVGNGVDNLKDKANLSKRDACKVQAVHFEKTQKEILSQLEEAFLKRKPSDLRKSFSGKFTSDSFSEFFDNNMEKNIGDDLRIVEHKKFKQLNSDAALNSSFEKYFKEFKTLEKAEFDVYQVSPIDKDETQVKLSVYFALKGLTSAGHRRQDSGKFSLDLIREDKHWLIRELKISEIVRLTNHGLPQYKALTTLNTTVYPRLEAIRRGGYALAIGDYDGDGNLDLLVGSYGPLEIYRGDGKGNFVKDENTGIPPYSLVKAAVWADFNNDGKQDLVLIRYIQDDPNETSDRNVSFKLLRKQSSVSIFENIGSGKFKNIDQELNIDRLVIEKAMPVAVGDFNGDGLLDIYVGYPGVKDFTSFTPANDKAKYGHKAQAVYINQGNMHFKAESMSTKIEDILEVFGSSNVIYPHSAMALDVNQDGAMDIAVVDDRGNISPIYLNDGKGKFKSSGKDLGLVAGGWGMGIAAADVNGDGKIDLALTVVTDNSLGQFSRCMGFQPERGLSLFVQNPGLKTSFKKYTKTDLDFPGQGLGGIEFIDFDMDGRPDLYVTNGLWSGSDKRAQDISGVVFRALGDEGPTIYEEAMSYAHVNSYVMDVLARHKDPEGRLMSMAGFQSNRLYKNLGNSHFVDVAYVEGVDSIYDGYMIAKADINNDGIQDIVLRNADPGTKDIKNPPVQIFLGQKKKNSIQIKLTGTASNRDGIGAEVRVESKGLPTQVQQMISNNGCIQSEKVLFFALGKNAAAEMVQVKWPSGKVETFRNMPNGVHNIHEGAMKISSHSQ